MLDAGKSANSRDGFSLIEMMLAVLILGGGLLALASAFAEGMILMSTSHYHQIAKEKASEAIESVTAARDTRTITWAQIRNVNAWTGDPVGGGIFLNGSQPLRTRGGDGLVNTADDGSVEAENLPGSDGILGTSDDVIQPLTAFTREIQISNVGASTNLRQIRVVVTYQVGHLTRTYELVTYISSFA